MTERGGGRILLFAPGRPGLADDDALVRTRWIADRTYEEIENCVPLFDDRATRADLHEAMTDQNDDGSASISGLVLFSHGRRAHLGRQADGRPSAQDDAIMGVDGPALDADNLSLLTGRWGHAVACHAGTELAAQAYVHGAVCFVGYSGALIVEWNPDAIPEEIRPLFVQLVTCTTRNLMEGVRDERTLRARVSRIADDIVSWCLDQHEGETGAIDGISGIEITAQQLVGLLVYRGPDG